MKQLAEIGVVDPAKAPHAKECFVKPALIGAAP